MGSIETTQRTCTSTRRLAGAGVIAILLLAGASCASDSKSSSATVAGFESAAAATVPPYTETAATTAEATATTAAATADSTASNETVPPAGDVAGSLAAATPLAGGATPGEVGLTSVNPFGTALAITAAVNVQVADVRAAVNDLPGLVSANGGAIFDSQVAVGDPASASASITVKIPPAGLEPLISGLGGLGELTGRTQQTEDVAEQLADTQNRIATAQASVDRVRFLLASATDLDAIIRIEGELTIRETSLEQLLATERNVTDRVQLATLTITLTPTPVVPVAVVAKADPIDVGARVEPSSSVARALNAGWHGFASVVHGIVIGAAFMLPVIVLLLVGGLTWLAMRRLRRRSPGVVTVAPAATTE